MTSARGGRAEVLSFFFGDCVVCTTQSALDPFLTTAKPTHLRARSERALQPAHVGFAAADAAHPQRSGEALNHALPPPASLSLPVVAAEADAHGTHIEMSRHGPAPKTEKIKR